MKNRFRVFAAAALLLGAFLVIAVIAAAPNAIGCASRVRFAQ